MKLRALTILLAAILPVGAQAPDAFEVASLKPSAPGARFSSKLDASQFNCTGHSLLMLIMSAYPDIEVQSWKVSGGPSWLKSDYWDLAAKLPPNMPTDKERLYRQTEAMLRTFLAEEFKLKTHRETKEYPVYALVVGKNGSKLKRSEATQISVKTGRGKLEFQHQSMAGLVQYLYNVYVPIQQAADRPVIDQTGLDGFFDFTLEWTPESSQPDPTATGPSIFTALEQQLGLKLQAEKSPFEFLVIDSAEKPAAP